MNGDGNPARARLRSLNETHLELEEAGLAQEPDPAQWSDEELMAAIAHHDEQAFGALYDRYADLVYSTSLRVLHDPQLAEDATQDIFVRLWERPGAFVSARGRFMSWLMSVTRNRAVDEIRARGRRQRREASGLESTDEPVGHVDRFENDPLRAAQAQEDQQSVRGALEGLPREQRVALELAYFRGLTQQEIAAKLHEPLGTVKTRIRLGMQKLRSSLEGQQH